MKVMIKHLLSIITLTIFYFSSFSQKKESFIIVRIDTLFGVNPLVDEFYVRVCFDTSDVSHRKDTFILSDLIKNGSFYSVELRVEKEYKTDYLEKITAIQSIDLLFDNAIGYISLRNINHISTDTLKINKWIVNRSNMPDTVKRGTVYQHLINDSLLSSYIKEDTFVVSSKFKTKRLKPSLVIINEKEFKLIPKIYSENIMGTGSGAKPRKTYKSFQENRRPNKKYKYTRFHGVFTKVKSAYNGVIYLNNL